MESEPESKSTITTMKAAQILGVSRDAVRFAARRNEIGTFVKGRYHVIRVFTPDDIDKIQALLTAPPRARKDWRPASDPNSTE